jgi:hypothetical protein
VRKDGVLDDIPTFTLEELRAIVDEVHRERRKVASHAMALNGVHNSVEAGVDTMERGNYICGGRSEDDGGAWGFLCADDFCRRVCGAGAGGGRGSGVVADDPDA